MSRIPVKNHGFLIPVKNHKVFLSKPQQICVKLLGIKWKTFPAKWKPSKLVDEKKTGSSNKSLNR